MSSRLYVIPYLLMARYKQATRVNEKNAKNREAQKKFPDRKKKEWKSQAEYVVELKSTNETLAADNSETYGQWEASIDSDTLFLMLDAGTAGDLSAQAWVPEEWSWDQDFSDPKTASLELFEPATTTCEDQTSFLSPDMSGTGNGYSIDHTTVNAATMPESISLHVLQDSEEQTTMQPASAMTLPTSGSEHDGGFFGSGMNLDTGLQTHLPTTLPNDVSEHFPSFPCHYPPTNSVSVYFQAVQYQKHAAKLLEMGLQLNALEGNLSLSYGSTYPQPMETLPWLDQSCYAYPLSQML
ncbi:hypothetical protein LTR81_028013 [Elasticomyces elasticus]